MPDDGGSCGGDCDGDCFCCASGRKAAAAGDFLAKADAAIKSLSGERLPDDCGKGCFCCANGRNTAGAGTLAEADAAVRSLKGERLPDNGGSDDCSDGYAGCLLS